MPFGRMTKIVMIIAMFAFIAAAALFGVYASIGAISFGHVLIDPLMYIGAFVFVFSVLVAALGVEFLIVGHVIIWGTYVACKMDRRRARQLLEQKFAQQYIRQHVQ